MRILSGLDDALSVTRLHPFAPEQRYRRVALPGLDGGRRSPAEAQAAPEWPGARRVDHGVPPERDQAASDGDLAGRDPHDGAPAEGQWPPSAVVPPVQERAEAPGQPVRRGTDQRDTVLAESARRALAKAAEGEWWRTVSWQPDRQCWVVPSASTPGRFYYVKRKPGATNGPWWTLLSCDCLTKTVNDRQICWHKAAWVLKFKRLGVRAMQQ